MLNKVLECSLFNPDKIRGGKCWKLSGDRITVFIRTLLHSIHFHQSWKRTFAKFQVLQSQRRPPTRAFSRLKAPTSAFTFKTLRPLYPLRQRPNFTSTYCIPYRGSTPTFAKVFMVPGTAVYEYFGLFVATLKSHQLPSNWLGSKSPQLVFVCAIINHTPSVSKSIWTGRLWPKLGSTWLLVIPTCCYYQ